MLSDVLSRVGIEIAARSPIGLDVTPSAVRAAQLRRANNGWTVRALGSWGRREDELGDRAPEGFARRIRRAMDHADFRGIHVMAGLTAPDIEFHMLEIPERGGLEDPQKFADAARWEMNRVTTLPDGQSVADFWRVPTSSGSRTTAIGVVANVTSVDKASQLIETIGLDCERVDTTACALVRLGSVLRDRPGVDASAVWAVLDIGERQSRLVIAIDGHPVLVRAIGNGGRGFTEVIAESLDVSVEAAEIHKRDHGIAVEDESGGPTNNVAGLIRRSLRGDLDTLVGEIERSYEYVMRCYPERNPGDLLLVGGGASLNGLSKELSERLGVVVERFSSVVAASDAAITVATQHRANVDAFACAIALALDPEKCA